VDQFRDQVAEEVERLVRRQQELEGKLQSFHEQLRAFRERDKANNEALVSAQQLRAEIREQAEREAQLVLREARADAERQVEGLRHEARRVEEEIAGLARARRAYLAQLRATVEKQLHELEAAEAGAAPPGAPSTRAEGDATPAHPTPAWLDSLMKE
jgi:cell division septum initiation protein DivIVA